MRVVVAPDKFKGSLSAGQVAAHVATGLRRAVPELEVDEVPIADGGEGTVDAALAAGFHRHTVSVSGPTGVPVQADLAVRGRTAVIEMASASGLSALPGGVPAPLTATTMGTGQLIRAALDLGAGEIVLGVGGSATIDGGAGLLVGLGARLLDGAGRELPGGGAALRDLVRVDLSGLDARLVAARVLLASDVDNPLLGPDGTAAVYGPQKGASPQDIAVAEAGLAQWVDVLEAALGPQAGAAAHAPGAGAAGGMGFAALAALGAVRRPGVEVVMRLVGLSDRLVGAALAVTGEGSLDRQSLRGKAPMGVAALGRTVGVPVVAVCGRCTLDDAAAGALGLAGVYPLTALEPDPDRCLAEAGALLERIAARIADERLP